MLNFDHFTISKSPFNESITITYSQPNSDIHFSFILSKGLIEYWISNNMLDSMLGERIEEEKKRANAKLYKELANNITYMFEKVK